MKLMPYLSENNEAFKKLFDEANQMSIFKAVSGLTSNKPKNEMQELMNEFLLKHLPDHIFLRCEEYGVIRKGTDVFGNSARNSDRGNNSNFNSMQGSPIKSPQKSKFWNKSLYEGEESQVLNKD